MIRTVSKLRLHSNHANPDNINLTQIRTSFYNKYMHGPTKISNPSPDYAGWFRRFFSREGVDFVKGEIVRTAKKSVRSTIPVEVEPNVTHKFEDFDTDESIKRWKPVADSDTLNGFSVSNMVRSPAGHALFKGVLDNRVPDDGLTQKSGFAGVIGPTKPRDRLISVEEFWDWQLYNCVEIKFRGDGRKYCLVLNTGTYRDDTAHYDHYSFPLYTKGGPYWQTYRIPLSKFIFCFKGFIQDQQFGPVKARIKFVALTLQDTHDGPFELEIDYIGLRYDLQPYVENSAYEMYNHPHIKLRQVQVDCAPPDTE